MALPSRGPASGRREGDRVRATGSERAQARAAREPRRRLRVAGHDLDEAKDAARAYANEEGLRFFEDGAEPLQYDAYEAIGEEIVDQCPAPPGAVVTPIGNGALAEGRRRDRKAGTSDRSGGSGHRADAGDGRELRRGRVVDAPAGTTVADGLGVRVAIPLAVERLTRRSMSCCASPSERSWRLWSRATTPESPSSHQRRPHSLRCDEAGSRESRAGRARHDRSERRSGDRRARASAFRSSRARDRL